MSGLKALFLNENSNTHYGRCCACSLQLTIQDSMKEGDLLTDIFGLFSEVSKFIRCSAKWTHALNQRKEDIQEPSIGIQILWPTRWDQLWFESTWHSQHCEKESWPPRNKDDSFILKYVKLHFVDFKEFRWTVRADVINGIITN